jgi:aspartyl-tRNA(Asn)/glutamyl-tRNA(Gln) amidotransferase subunit A
MKPSRSHASDFDHGIRPFAPSLDHVGPLARTVDDLRTLFDAMDDYRSMRREERSDLAPREDPPWLGRLRGFFDRRADPAVLAALDDAIGALSARGASFVELDDPVDFDQVVQDHRRVMAAEAAGVHSDWLTQFPDDYPPRIRELILEGRSLTALEYLIAKERMNSTLSSIARLFDSHEISALITPATVSTAVDLSTTGDPAFNSPWSYTYLPTVSFATDLAADGLPVAIQLVGNRWRDQLLLAVAGWCEGAIRAWRQ